MLKKLSITLLTLAIFIVSACTFGENSICTNFTDITSPGSNDITFKVTFEEEKRYFDKGFDILIKADTNNAEFLIKKELDDFVKITLKDKDTYYSLYKLMADAKNRKFEYITYKNAISKIYIINSQSNFTLTLKAVIGEISQYKSSLLNTFDMSKVFKLNVKKTSNN